jgi:ATP-dependent RNA helicase SUPV3L1/SUV3
VAGHVARLDRNDGDIDTLMARIAHIRTWTYISHRPGWLADAAHWQETSRAVEDKLSDALHRALTQRFVDRRQAHLLRRMEDGNALVGSVWEPARCRRETMGWSQLAGFPSSRTAPASRIAPAAECRPPSAAREDSRTPRPAGEARTCAAFAFPPPGW